MEALCWAAGGKPVDSHLLAAHDKPWQFCITFVPGESFVRVFYRRLPLTVNTSSQTNQQTKRLNRCKVFTVQDSYRNLMHSHGDDEVLTTESEGQLPRRAAPSTLDHIDGRVRHIAI